MDRQQKETLLRNMADHLPALRKQMGLNQTEMAALIGVGRSTLAAVENRKKELPWEMFLALLYVFTENPETNQRLKALGIRTEMDGFIRHASA